MSELSKNTLALIEQLKDRDALGMRKYGVSLDRTDMTPLQWLQHLQEEMLDGAAYIEGLKQQFASLLANPSKSSNSANGPSSLEGSTIQGMEWEISMFQFGRWYIAAKDVAMHYLHQDGRWHTGVDWQTCDGYWPTESAARTFAEQVAAKEAK